MENLLQSLAEFLTGDRVVDLLRALSILVVGLIVARLVAASISRVVSKRADVHQTVLVKRITFYTLATLFIVTALMEIGFNFGVLLGAAGIFTIALGFASQTSASNVISGLFLLGERPFEIGDVIRIGDTTGEVLSIDLLSVKLRTLENLYVRVANENLIKSQITNLTRFPIRRVDLKIGVAYKEQLDHVYRVLAEVADRNPLVLEEPRPTVLFSGYGDSALEFTFAVWVPRERFFELKTRLYTEIKVAFDREGIEIPFPHRTLYAGSDTEPLPVRMVQDASK